MGGVDEKVDMITQINEQVAQEINKGASNRVGLGAPTTQPGLFMNLFYGLLTQIDQYRGLQAVPMPAELFPVVDHNKKTVVPEKKEVSNNLLDPEREEGPEVEQVEENQDASPSPREQQSAVEKEDVQKEACTAAQAVCNVEKSPVEVEAESSPTVMRQPTTNQQPTPAIKPRLDQAMVSQTEAPEQITGPMIEQQMAPQQPPPVQGPAAPFAKAPGLRFSPGSVSAAAQPMQPLDNGQPLSPQLNALATMKPELVANLMLPRGAQGLTSLLQAVMTGNGNGLGVQSSSATAGRSQNMFSDMSFLKGQSMPEQGKESPISRLASPQQARFIEKIQQVLEAAAKSRDASSITLTLDPPDLGSVTVKLTQRSDQVFARLSPETPEVEAALRARLPELTQSLANAGIKPENIHVSVGQEKSFAEFSLFGDLSHRGAQRHDGRGEGKRFAGETHTPHAATHRRDAVTGDDSWVA